MNKETLSKCFVYLLDILYINKYNTVYTVYTVYTLYQNLKLHLH